LLLLAPVAAASAAEPSCRADAARVTVGDLAVADPEVANAAAGPCLTDRASVADAQPIGPLTVRAPEAATRRAPNVAAATASIAGAELSLGGVAISVGAVRASQAAACVDGAPTTEGGSHVDALVIGGRAVPIVADRPVDLAVGPVRVRANQVDGGTRRALVLDAGDIQVVLGEATVEGDPCAGAGSRSGDGTGSSGGSGSGTGTTGANDRRICAEGATYDAARGVCVIHSTGRDGTVTAVDAGRPFQGPSGGRLMTLEDARALAAAGRLPRSNCLSGPGPRYVIVGTEGADRITGTNGRDRVIAAGGADRVDGGRGDDCLDGGSGRDVLSGALGDDRAYGGTGNDAVNGGSGTDRLSGGAGNDTINTGFGRDRVSGGSGNDAINAATAGPASARIDCGSGRDTLRANRNERRRLVGCERRSLLR
jgi:Ca2+-binding RTX toxin-like protein